MPNGETYAIFDGMFLRNHENKYVFEYGGRDKSESLLFDFVSADGTIWGNPYENSGWGIHETLTSNGSYYNVGSSSTIKCFDVVFIDSSHSPHDTTWGIVDLPDVVVAKGIGIVPSSGYSYLNGCIINGVQYGTITDVENKNNIIKNFKLNQNYPNPFNPTTQLSYQLPKSGFVNLTVYNIIGQEIATLVNKQQSTGSYEVKFDASGLTSGIYFYKLHASTASGTSFVESKKMLLIK